jgi:hypothetical protein
MSSEIIRFAELFRLNMTLLIAHRHSRRFGTGQTPTLRGRSDLPKEGEESLSVRRLKTVIHLKINSLGFTSWVGAEKILLHGDCILRYNMKFLGQVEALLLTIKFV